MKGVDYVMQIETNCDGNVLSKTLSAGQSSGALGLSAGGVDVLIKPAMIDLIKKGMLAGVGAAVVTKESAEKALSELVEKGKISTGEAREMADKIVDEGRREFEKSKGEAQAWFDDMLGRANVATRSELEALSAKVAALEAKLAVEDKPAE